MVCVLCVCSSQREELEAAAKVEAGRVASEEMKVRPGISAKI